VEEIRKIRKVSIFIFIVPIVALNLCLFISINYDLLENTIFVVDQIGRSGFSIPYIDGSLSISRSARTYPAYLVFKPSMILTAILLIMYWRSNNILFKKINNIENKKNNSFFIFGVGSAIFLILHSILLGIDLDINIYKFARRFILLGFIIFEIVAQTLFVLNIMKVKSKISDLINNKILKLKIILVSILVVVAFIAAPILNSSEYVHFKHALEWNYFLGVVTFYLLTFMFWKKG
tara:strand:+ start:398 stop:1102 length:705 start_codon:yes stop_codon:yes gene_type:complete